VYEARENGLPDYEDGIVTHEFLRELANHLEANEELDIQTAWFTKCRFPVPAKRYVVRNGASRGDWIRPGVLICVNLYLDFVPTGP
jgi:hypothetical protein